MYLIIFYLSIILSPLFIHALPTNLFTLDSLLFRKTLTSTPKTNFQSIKPSFKKTSSSSSTSLYNDHSFLYLIEIGIGSKDQKFTVAVDTGSADLWVPSSKCPDESCASEKYDTSKIDSKNDLKEPFSVSYGSGDIEGEYYKDTVTIGNTKVNDQQFGAVNKVTRFTLSSQTDHPTLNGLLGLGFPGLTGSKDHPYDPIMITMFKQKLIQEPLFTIFLNGRENHDEYSGEINFGKIDSSKYQGEGGLKYAPVVPGKSGEFAHWSFHIQQIKLNDQVYPINKDDVFIFDTGSSLSYIPQSIFDSILKQLEKKGKDIYLDKNSGVYGADCSYAKDESNLIEFTLPSSNQQQPITISIPFSDTLLTDDPNSIQICTFGFQPMDPQSAKDGLYNGNMYVLGDSVLRSLYLAFHFGNKSIGIAAAKNDHGNKAKVI